ncbi:YraN family protein [Desulfovibrio oxyclinae]|uniref:YraN family protein n=1 Tax=Desulfovibrio oxyclinae TaxID=63560 RepID=UPI001B7FCF0E|nr:YraN family protein [Desulfovibrio oxyclinae]
MRAILKSIMPGAGGMGEDAAARHLESEGVRVLERNWRHGRLELDLVCRDGDTLVFVEVKTRGRGSRGCASQALSREKCSRLVRAASHYLSASDQWEVPCRFDLAAVSEGADGLEITLYRDVIDAADYA